MHGFALAFLGVSLAGDPIELPKDVYEIPSRRFAMPLRIGPDNREKIEKIRLFVSEDQGKTWKKKKNYKPSATRVVFTAPRDGQYWFAIQVVRKDGGMRPSDQDNLVPLMKVYINSERRVLKPQKSYEELQREVEQLRRTVEELQTKIKQLESDRKPK